MVHTARPTTTTHDAPSFPYLRDEIDEDPARWLAYCEDHLDQRVASLLAGMRSLERARNWQYAAQRLEIDQRTVKQVDRVVDALSNDAEPELDVEQRTVARAAADRLQAIWQADTPEAVRELQAAEAAGESRRVVIALANHRLDVLQSDDATESDEAESDAAGESIDAESVAVPEEYDQDSYERACSIAGSFDEAKLRETLANERARDEPRPAKLAALVDLLAEKTETTTDMTTTTQAADTATERTA